MTTTDTEMLRHVSAEQGTRNLLTRGCAETSEALNENGREMQKLLKRYAEKTGFPIDELNRLRAERTAEQRRLFDSQVAHATRIANEEEVGFRQVMESQHEAFNVLAPLVTTIGQPTDIVLLDNVQPVDFSKHIESLNSFCRVHIRRHSGRDTPRISFVFSGYSNIHQDSVIANISTLLRFSGGCEVIADSGIFSGHHNSLQVAAVLSAVRDDGTPLVLLPTPHNTFQTVAFLDVTGGGLFGEHGYALKIFMAKPIGLDADFIIPAGATVIIYVTLQIIYSIQKGDNIDLVNVFFSRVQQPDGNIVEGKVGCPFVHVEVL